MNNVANLDTKRPKSQQCVGQCITLPDDLLTRRLAHQRFPVRHQVLKRMGIVTERQRPIPHLRTQT